MVDLDAVLRLAEDGTPGVAVTASTVTVELDRVASPYAELQNLTTVIFRRTSDLAAVSWSNGPSVRQLLTRSERARVIALLDGAPRPPKERVELPEPLPVRRPALDPKRIVTCQQHRQHRQHLQHRRASRSALSGSRLPVAPWVSLREAALWCSNDLSHWDLKQITERLFQACEAGQIRTDGGDPDRIEPQSLSVWRARQRRKASEHLRSCARAPLRARLRSKKKRRRAKG